MSETLRSTIGAVAAVGVSGGLFGVMWFYPRDTGLASAALAVAFVSLFIAGWGVKAWPEGISEGVDPQ